MKKSFYMMFEEAWHLGIEQELLNERDLMFLFKGYVCILIIIAHVLLLASCTPVLPPEVCAGPYVVSVSAGAWRGSGTVFDGGRRVYVTRHQIGDLDLVDVETFACGDETESRSAMVESFAGEDLVILRVSGNPLPYWVERRPYPVLPGDTVRVYGVMTSGLSGEVTTGNRASVPVQHGDSGGAVVDEQGYLVGIVRAAVCAESGCTRTASDEKGELTFENTYVGVEWLNP